MYLLKFYSSMPRGMVFDFINLLSNDRSAQLKDNLSKPCCLAFKEIFTLTSHPD